MLWCVAVDKTTVDPEAKALEADIRELHVRTIVAVRITRLYYLEGQLDECDVLRIASSLLSDPVTERFTVLQGRPGRGGIEVLFNPGVMDPSVDSIVRALAVMGYSTVRVRTGKLYSFRAKDGQRPLGENEVAPSVRMLVANPVIQHIARPGEAVFVQPRQYRFRQTIINIRTLTPAALDELSRKGMLALSREEMLALQRYYRRIGRDPTDVELETFAQTWSEHCQHKTFRGRIRFGDSVIRNLLKSTIFRVTKELGLRWCLSVFEDNSGVIEFDADYGLSFKVETHNHPSALEPYGGAATGIGGVVRDCLGTGLGAKPILNTDVFCFAPVDMRPEDVPQGALHPRRVMKGVVAGVRDYGNRMGIPTANGAVYFDPGFVGNPLVFCGTVGLIPKSLLRKSPRKGQAIVLFGGRTGRDGIHGVTFASLGLGNDTSSMSGGAVQIGNPIEEKKVLDVVLAARSEGLFSAITDCGGGGLSSAIGELARDVGCVVWLDRVPLKYVGLSPAEIWISEAQERMVAFVERSNVGRLLKLCREHNVEATVIGRLTGNGRLRLRFRRHLVGDIDMKFLATGWRALSRTARWQRPETADPAVPFRRDLTDSLVQLLQAPNIANKEWVVRQYDHEVQGQSVVKPFCGVGSKGPTDACVITPLPHSRRASIVSCGICPRYGLIDPYWMAASAIDEALRNCVAVGGDIDRIALLDNFCWGSPEQPELLGGLVRAAQACYDIARHFRTPFISGKDSLYNEFRLDSGSIMSIPPTLLISAIGVIADASKTTTSDFKSNDSIIYIVGETFNELGGSEYFRINQGLGREVPRVNPGPARQAMSRVGRAIRAGLVRACHDLSEGGLGVALAEMAIGGGIGASIRLDRVPGAHRFRRDDFLLFSESNSRFLCEVGLRQRSAFERLLGRIPYAPIGRTRADGLISVAGRSGDTIVRLEVTAAESVWQRALTKKL